MVYPCCMVMRDAVDHPTIRNYRKLIQNFAGIFGTKCWPLLYQAEPHMRREGLERLRRIECDKFDEQLLANPNGAFAFDKARP